MISINNMFKFISQKLSGLLGIKNVKKWKMIDEKMNTNNNLYKKSYKHDYGEYYLGPLCKLRDWVKINIIDWNILSLNPNAIHLLEKNPDKINWPLLSINPNAIHLLEQNQHKINWWYLSGNPNAIHLLEQNKNKIYWCVLSENPNAIHILEQNIDKIDWFNLSRNPNAIHLLEQNLDKINWYNLLGNPSIFEYDYESIKKRMNIIAEELIANRFHPRNFDKFVSWGFEEFQLD